MPTPSTADPNGQRHQPHGDPGDAKSVNTRTRAASGTASCIVLLKTTMLVGVLSP
jgi:hypothetical protein